MRLGSEDLRSLRWESDCPAWGVEPWGRSLRWECAWLDISLSEGGPPTVQVPCLAPPPQQTNCHASCILSVPSPLPLSDTDIHILSNTYKLPARVCNPIHKEKMIDMNHDHEWCSCSFTMKILYHWLCSHHVTKSLSLQLTVNLSW